MSLYDHFLKFVKNENLFNAGEQLLLTVSGGIDSIVLCHLCKQAGFNFKLAHCNFQLRGEESEGDEKFVKELAVKYGVDLLVERFDTVGYAEGKGVSIQVAARELRYEWFNSIPAVDYILTAHHADDAIETVMMNFFKGTGIGGLHGILPRQGRLVRPLLFAFKKDILAYAKENNLPYVEDSSNSSDKYTRNYFRNQLIPALEKVYPAVKENLQNSIARFRDAEVLYKQSVDLHIKKLLEYKGGEIFISILKLQKSAPVETILYEIIKGYNFTPGQVQDVLQIASSESGKYVASSTHRIIKNRKWLIISSAKAAESAFVTIEEQDRVINYPAGRLKKDIVQAIDFQPLSSPAVAMIDAGMMEYPLLLRKCKQGDYFYPLGMKRKKKLSRFFIDQKMSLTDKETAWVVEMNKKIIWVVGRRIDDRFKITPSCKKVMILQVDL